MLTFEGANVDIFVGLSAPLAAWASTKGSKGLRVATRLECPGLLALANVATRAVLSAPGPLNVIHAEVPNLSIGTFPFVYIAGLFAPLAVTLHILASAHCPRPTPAPRSGSSARPYTHLPDSPHSRDMAWKSSHYSA